MRTLQFIVISLLLGMFAASARAMTADTVYMYTSDVLRPQTAVMPAWPDTTSLALFNAANRHAPINIYRMPYSLDASSPDWHRMWINTAVLSGAFVSTLFVLECLPEDATSWNRAAIQSVPPFKRWFRNVFKRGPEWDHDNPIFNYVLHPYAGAAYFMSARKASISGSRCFTRPVSPPLAGSSASKPSWSVRRTRISWSRR